MSEDTGAVVSSCCASCGIEEIDDINLKECDDCDLARYCSDECQENHKSEHEEACKKRAVELRDEILFKQPESSCYDDCPICCLPLSINGENSTRMSCCLEYICNGCYYANMKREILGRLQHSCPFCRRDFPKTEIERYEQLMKRVEAKDPLAMCLMGIESYDEGDVESAFEYWTKAVALGDVHAHYELSRLYHDGKGVEKDEKKKFYHLEEAASRGHPNARQTLGLMEAEKRQDG